VICYYISYAAIKKKIGLTLSEAYKGHTGSGMLFEAHFCPIFDHVVRQRTFS
jgi:hypothetical protein